MESLGRYADEDGERDLYLAWVPSLEEWRLLAADSRWRETVEDSPAGFALFLACDAEGLSADLIGDFASYCIQHGLFWVSIWGPDCERVHDIFDEVDIDQEAEPGTVMSTWHDDESLEGSAGPLLGRLPQRRQARRPSPNRRQRRLARLAGAAPSRRRPLPPRPR